MIAKPTKKVIAEIAVTVLCIVVLFVLSIPAIEDVCASAKEVISIKTKTELNNK